MKKNSCKENIKGFSLIELLVVVLIIGILAAIALPQYQKAVEKSRAMEAITILKTLHDQQAFCFLEHGMESGTCTQGDLDGNNLFTADVQINVHGDPESDCWNSVCGPTTNDFSYELDGEFIYAVRKPINTKYYLETTAHPESEGDTKDRIGCVNQDESKNWCNIIGFTKAEGSYYFQ